jgi:hypothetical protein
MVFLFLRRLTPGAVTPGLLAASLAFYGWEDPFRLLPLIGWSITLNLIGRYLFCKPKQWGNTLSQHHETSLHRAAAATR